MSSEQDSTIAIPMYDMKRLIAIRNELSRQRNLDWTVAKTFALYQNGNQRSHKLSPPCDPGGASTNDAALWLIAADNDPYFDLVEALECFFRRSHPEYQAEKTAFYFAPQNYSANHNSPSVCYLSSWQNPSALAQARTLYEIGCSSHVVFIFTNQHQSDFDAMLAFRPENLVKSLSRFNLSRSLPSQQFDHNDLFRILTAVYQMDGGIAGFHKKILFNIFEWLADASLLEFANATDTEQLTKVLSLLGKSEWRFALSPSKLLTLNDDSDALSWSEASITGLTDTQSLSAEMQQLREIVLRQQDEIKRLQERAKEAATGDNAICGEAVAIPNRASSLMVAATAILYMLSQGHGGF